MRLKDIIKLSTKPTLYSKGTSIMWKDPYISNQLLETHLSQGTDLASRKDETIAGTVNWILEQAPAKKMSLLDIGCGPGLYAEKFAEKGHSVTGIDFSEKSIGYAKRVCSEKGLNIRYRVEDYLSLNNVAEFDLVILIFTDFGVLFPEERQMLMKRIFTALKPGGFFIFDVLNQNFSAGAEPSPSWEAAEKGFWRGIPYLALSDTFLYEREDVILNQHIVLDETGRTEVYRFWAHRFTDGQLSNMLTEAGFSNIKCHRNVIPSSELYRAEDVTFCVAQKK